MIDKQVLGLSIQEEENGVIFSHFSKDFVMQLIEKMGILKQAPQKKITR